MGYLLILPYITEGAVNLPVRVTCVCWNLKCTTCTVVALIFNKNVLLDCRYLNFVC